MKQKKKELQSQNARIQSDMSKLQAETARKEKQNLMGKPPSRKAGVERRTTMNEKLESRTGNRELMKVSEA